MTGRKSTSLRASVFFLLTVLLGAGAFSQEEVSESWVLSVFFNEEKVGYEEYTWDSDDLGYTLTVQGRMDSPVPILIRRLILRLDRSFIPRKFTFLGTIGGMEQEIISDITDGRVENTIRVAGQEQQKVVQIKRDAFLLPNPIFSAYMVLTKKYRCNLEERLDLSAYIIPQMEIPFILVPQEEAPCVYLLQMEQTEAVVQTDETGALISLTIPSQRIKVLQQ